uniref:Uncharacterized protein n=1 Tax=Plectus sambesii TaxID=2011161 RepID=A0A914V5X3_9BILA
MFGRRAHSARDDSQIGRFAVGFVPFERLQRELFVAADVAVCRPVESKPALAVVRARCRVKSRRAPVTRSIVDDKSPDLARFMRFGLIDHRAHPFVFCRMAVAATAATAPLPPQPPPPPLQLTTATATTTAGGSALENYNLSWKGRQQRDECDPNSATIDQRPVCIAADHAGDNLLTDEKSVLDMGYASNSAVANRCSVMYDWGGDASVNLHERCALGAVLLRPLVGPSDGRARRGARWAAVKRRCVVSFGAHLSVRRSATDWLDRRAVALITVYVWLRGSLVGLTSRLLHTGAVNVANVDPARRLLSALGAELLDGPVSLAYICYTSAFQPRDPNGNIRSMKSLQQSFPNPDAPAAPSSSSLTLSSSLSSSAVKPLQRRANNNSMSLSMDNVQLKDALRTRNNCRYVCVLEHIYILNCLSRSPTGRSFRGGRRSATRRQAVWPNRKSDSLERLILASGRNGNKIGSNEQRISCCRCDGWRKQETREPSAEGYR